MKKIKIKREKSTSSKNHYVTNATLLPAVIEAKALGKVTDKLIRMIMMIAERYSRKGNFVGYSFREDMVSTAQINLCNNALKFNPEKSNNPFSYYTTGIHHSFLQYMADEKKHRNIRDALVVDGGANPSYNYMGAGEQHEDGGVIQSDDVMILDSKELTPDDLQFDKTPDVIPQPTKARHPKWASRDPGPITTYKPSDYDIDPVTGKITIKETAKPIPVPVKKVAKVPSQERNADRSALEADFADVDISEAGFLTHKRNVTKTETKKKASIKKTPIKKK